MLIESKTHSPYLCRPILFDTMEYKKIVSVTGLPGLFELLSSKSDGAVVRSLEDQTTKFVSSRRHNFSHLESIEVYTHRDNDNLKDVFVAMKNSDEEKPAEKASSAELKAYFEKVYPDLDFSRVYASDMKKMIRWFHILINNNIALETPQQDEASGNADGANDNEKAEDADNTLDEKE